MQDANRLSARYLRRERENDFSRSVRELWRRPYSDMWIWPAECDSDSTFSEDNLHRQRRFGVRLD